MERDVKYLVENEWLAALTEFIRISKNVCGEKGILIMIHSLEDDKFNSNDAGLGMLNEYFCPTFI